MRRTNTTAIASACVTDIPPDLVSPGAVELVLDIRREYAKKLEQVSLLLAHPWISLTLVCANMLTFKTIVH